jgi:hypothetical protein
MDRVKDSKKVILFSPKPQPVPERSQKEIMEERRNQREEMIKNLQGKYGKLR